MGEFFRHYVLHNLGLKLISLGLAVGLWLAVARDPAPAEVVIELPIEFHHVPDNLEISSESIPQAQIRVRGPQTTVRRLQPSDIHAEINLSGVGPGERTFDLTSQQIHQPHGLEVVQVMPSQVRLTFDKRLTRQVEIHPRVIGSFAAGLKIGRIVVVPPTITISGPQKRVEVVEAAITDAIDVSGTLERGTFVTHAYVSDPMVQVVRPIPIRVTITMEKASSGK